MILTDVEKQNLQYILPAQSNLKTLALVDSILVKASGTDSDVILSKEETELLKVSIGYMDQASVIPYPCFSLVKKILQGD